MGKERSRPGIEPTDRHPPGSARWRTACTEATAHCRPRAARTCARARRSEPGRDGARRRRRAAPAPPPMASDAGDFGRAAAVVSVQLRGRSRAASAPPLPLAVAGSSPSHGSLRPRSSASLPLPPPALTRRPTAVSPSAASPRRRAARLVCALRRCCVGAAALTNPGSVRASQTGASGKRRARAGARCTMALLPSPSPPRPSRSTQRISDMNRAGKPHRTSFVIRSSPKFSRPTRETPPYRGRAARIATSRSWTPGATAAARHELVVFRPPDAIFRAHPLTLAEAQAESLGLPLLHVLTSRTTRPISRRRTWPACATCCWSTASR